MDKIRGTKNEGVDYRHCRRWHFIGRTHEELLANFVTRRDENVEKYGQDLHVKVISSSRWSCKAEIIEDEQVAKLNDQFAQKNSIVESA